jgi:hypothetical protein
MSGTVAGTPTAPVCNEIAHAQLPPIAEVRHRGSQTVVTHSRLVTLDAAHILSAHRTQTIHSLSSLL